MPDRPAAADHPISAQDLKRAIGWAPDGRFGNLWVEVRQDIHNARDLRATLLNLGYAVQIDAAFETLVVLVKSRISAPRLRDELALFGRLVGPRLAAAIHVLSCEHAQDLVLSKRLSDEALLAWLKELTLKKTESGAPSSSRHVVSGLMFTLLASGVTTTTASQIGVWAGASHPTVTGVLKAFVDAAAVRRVHGQVLLGQFPITLWRRWLNMEASNRKSVCFVDTSGQPRSAQSLARRLQRLGRTDIAVGGILGGTHYYPCLDLTGGGRLELTVHGRASSDLSFVKELDPALVRSDKGTQNAQVVVHYLQRPASLYETDETGILWADPVSCMADMWAAGFEPQAEELLQHLLAKRQATGTGRP